MINEGTGTKVTVSSVHPLRCWPVDRSQEIDGISRGSFKIRKRLERCVKVRLLEDFHLHELADLDSSEANTLLDFSNTYGLLSLPRPLFESMELPHIASALRFWSKPPWYRTNEPFLEVRETQLAAKLLNAATSTLIAYRTGKQLSPTWSALGLQVPTDDRQAMRWFSEVVNSGLVSSYPTVFVQEAEAAESHREVRLEAGRAVTLFEALCIRIYNDVATGAVYSYCENELCGRAFAYRRTSKERAKVRKSGVRYCTDRCKQAQDAREFRKRRKDMDIGMS